jgi:hypothetical protein
VGRLSGLGYQSLEVQATGVPVVEQRNVALLVRVRVKYLPDLDCVVTL